MKRRYVTKDCLFCGKDASLDEMYERNFRDEDLTSGVFSARRQTEHFHYRMVRCRGCGLLFSREILSDDDLQELYSGSKFTFGEYTGTLRRDYWRPLARYQHELQGADTLEIGCSNGFFLEELQARGVARAWGCEPSDEARGIAHPSVKDRIVGGLFRGRDSFRDRSFRAVCSFHTLDHVPDPSAFLQDCRDVLEPGGLVYVVTHDAKALQARVLGEKSPIIDVEHVYLFDKQTLPGLLEQSGFEVLRVGSLLNSYPLGYWLRMLKLPSPKPLSKVGFPIPAGNIYALARLPA